MDLAQLQAFLAVADGGSFSAAAEALFLTQPAVSKRIAALESELRAALFDRIGRNVGLTEAGRALLPHARLMLQEAEDGRRAIANLSREVTGRLSLGASHHVGLHRLPEVLRRYVRAYPQVELELRFMESEEACLAVEHGELDLALITLPPAARPALELKPVWEDTLVVVTGRGQPVPDSLAALVAAPAILPDPTTYTRALIEEAFRERRLTLRVAQNSNFLETIKMLVGVGLGWSVLPEGMVEPGGELVVHRFPELALRRRLGVARHTRRTLSNAARAFWELLAEGSDAERERRVPA